MSKANFLSMPEPAFFNVILKDGVEQKTYFTHLSLELTFQNNNKLKLALILSIYKPLFYNGGFLF